MGYLFQHLRPEFVSRYPKKLCSDAFSPFILLRGEYENNLELKKEISQIHRDIKEATEYLINTTIPSFVDVLESYDEDLLPFLNLIHEIHFYGINVRFLGFIYAICEKRNLHYWSSIILVEMISRVFKDIVNRLLRDKMEEYRYPGEGIYRREIIEFLNLIVAPSEESTIIWDNDIYSNLYAKFEQRVGSL